MPLAYVVLRAKDEAVDRLPPTQFDLEFSDGEGQVRLPVRSQVVLLDARSKTPPARGSHDVKIRQLFDDREIAKGNVRLEIVATARGLAPELTERLQDPARIPGFEVKQTVEQGLSVTSLNAAESVEALTERRWFIDLTPAADSPPASFNFPTPANTAYAVTFQRYADADIVDTAASTPLHWPVIHSARHWIWPAAGTGVVAILAVALVIFLRRRQPSRALARAYSHPQQLTPFTLLGLLRRIRSDASLRFSAGEQQDLNNTIAELESQFFGRGKTGQGLELDAIVSLWLSRASRTC